MQMRAVTGVSHARDFHPFNKPLRRTSALSFLRPLTSSRDHAGFSKRERSLDEVEVLGFDPAFHAQPIQFRIVFPEGHGYSLLGDKNPAVEDEDTRPAGT